MQEQKELARGGEGEDFGGAAEFNLGQIGSDWVRFVMGLNSMYRIPGWVRVCTPYRYWDL